jgi:hypothetical protein
MSIPSHVDSESAAPSQPGNSAKKKALIIGDQSKMRHP